MSCSRYQRWDLDLGENDKTYLVDGNQKSGESSPVEGTVDKIYHYKKGFEKHLRWLAWGFLNHQQYE